MPPGAGRRDLAGDAVMPANLSRLVQIDKHIADAVQQM
ncbi:MAG: hypothetical protein ACJAWY_001359 [Sphingomonas echinoides]|jgi:hypothetical protein